MDSFSKCVFVRAGKHTSVHDMHPHSNHILTNKYNRNYIQQSYQHYTMVIKVLEHEEDNNIWQQDGELRSYDLGLCERNHFDVCTKDHICGSDRNGKFHKVHHRKVTCRGWSIEVICNWYFA